MTKPCDGCSEALGGRYDWDGESICWPCLQERTDVKPLPAYYPTKPPEWVLFRQKILDALVRTSPARFVYIDSNTCIGACPVCEDGTARVVFHGIAVRCDIECSLGCSQDDIAHGLNPELRKVA